MTIPAMTDLDPFIRLIAILREVLGERRFRAVMRKQGFRPIPTGAGVLAPWCR